MCNRRTPPLATDDDDHDTKNSGTTSPTFYVSALGPYDPPGKSLRGSPSERPRLRISRGDFSETAYGLRAGSVLCRTSKIGISLGYCLCGHPTRPLRKMRTRRHSPSAGEAAISGGRPSIPALVAAGPPAAPPSQYLPNGEKLIVGDRRWRPPSARGAGWSDRFNTTTNWARGRAQNQPRMGP